MPEDGGWTSVRSQSDLEGLLDYFGGFHDALLKEIHLVNGGYVQGEDLGMFTEPFSARVLFQRQFRDPSALEVILQGLQSLRIESPREIYSGRTETSEGHEKETLLVLKLDTAEFTFRELRYRDASEWMGAEARLGPEWT